MKHHEKNQYLITNTQYHPIELCSIGIIDKFIEEVRVLAEGIIKWFSNKKGYGFIEQEGDKDLFVHHSAINMTGFKSLEKGDRVSFDVAESDRGPEAKNVTKL